MVLQQVVTLLGKRSPIVVLSTVWLAEVLAEALPVTLLVEPDGLRSAVRAVKRAEKAGHRLVAAMAGEELPLLPASVDAVVVDTLTDMEDDDARSFLGGIVAALRPGGILVSVDATRERAVEAKLSRRFVAACLQDVGQERPRDGVVVTVGAAPPHAVLAAWNRP